MEDVGIFDRHLVFVFSQPANWYTLGTFGIFCGNMVHFAPFWYVEPRKIWQPW
jgi:hypothetical protein